MKILRYLVIAGNLLFVLWVLANGIDSGFNGTAPEIASFIFLVILLAANSLLSIEDGCSSFTIVMGHYIEVSLRF